MKDENKINIENELLFIGKGLDVIQLMLIKGVDLSTFKEFTNKVSDRMEKLTNFLRKQNNKKEEEQCLDL